MRVPPSDSRRCMASNESLFQRMYQRDCEPRIFPRWTPCFPRTDVGSGHERTKPEFEVAGEQCQKFDNQEPEYSRMNSLIGDPFRYRIPPYRRRASILSCNRHQCSAAVIRWNHAHTEPPDFPFSSASLRSSHLTSTLCSDRSRVTIGSHQQTHERKSHTRISLN